jgi:hypothetical protein
MTAAAAAFLTAGTIVSAGAAAASPVAPTAGQPTATQVADQMNSTLAHAPLEQVLPVPPTGLTLNGAKPGLIAADKLHVVKETGEWNGDEPVMLTVRLESVLGKAKSTKVTLVNSSPGEIGSGVDAGQTVGIPDREGDMWFGVAPLTSSDVLDAAIDQTPVAIPVVVTATVMLEGDLSNGPMIGAMGQTVADHLQRSLAPQLENTKVMIDPNFKVSGLEDALSRIQTAATPNSDVITQLVVQKIQDWTSSFADPDDPVGISLTALVPVDKSVTDFIKTPSALGLDSQYMKVTKHPVRTMPFDTDIELRTGLLVPPSALNGAEQQWWTTYSGDYVLDAPVEYRVWNHAWPQINW